MIKLHSIFSIYTEDAAPPAGHVCRFYTCNKKQTGLNGKKTKQRKLARCRLNVNKHQSDESHLRQKFRAWSRRKKPGEKEGRHRWHATQHRTDTLDRFTTHLEDCQTAWWSSTYLELGTSKRPTLDWIKCRPIREEDFKTTYDDDDGVTGDEAQQHSLIRHPQPRVLNYSPQWMRHHAF